MTSTGFHDVGEEWAYKWQLRQDLLGTRDTTIEILVYDDATDGLVDSDDIGAIGTEPTGGNYARPTVTLDSSDVSIAYNSGDVEVSGTVNVPLDGASNGPDSVDAYGAVVSFQSDVVNAEGGQNPHLLVTDTFAEGSFQVSAQNSIDVSFTLSGL